MKRIAVIKKELPSSCSHSGGIEKIALHLIQFLKNQKAHITLCTSSLTTIADELLLYPKKSLFKFREIQAFDDWCCLKLRSLPPFDAILSLDRSSIQTHHRAGNGVHAAYLELRKKRVSRWKSVSFYLNPLHKTFLKLEKNTFEDQQLKKIIVNSEMVKKQVLHHYAVPIEKIEVIHNGARASKAEFEGSFTHKSALAIARNLDPFLFHFLFIGCNFERKGLFPLLRALAELQNREVHLSVVGHDKRIDWFKAKSLELGIASQVTFFEYQSNVTPFYQICDVFLIPSLYDPFANTTVEALAMGLFVISSKYNGGHEIITDRTGIVVDDPYHIDQMTTALKASLKYRKNRLSAETIRDSVGHLTLETQLEKMSLLCLS